MKNVILITVDSLRVDYLGRASNINALAQESYAFNNAFSVGPVSNQSIISILSSTYPLDFTGPKAEKPRIFLGEFFKNCGFVAAAFHSTNYLRDYLDFNWDISNKINLAEKKELGDKKVFKKLFRIFEKTFLNYFPSVVFGARYFLYRAGLMNIKSKFKAADLNKQVKDFLKTNKTPFFLWIHYMDVHEPYLPYDNYFKDRKLSYEELVGYYFYRTKNKKFLKKYLKKAKKLYQDGVKYLDRQIGDLFDFLKNNNIWSESIIVFTSDHGEDFLTHEAGHYDGLYNELLHVPLIVKVPGEKAEAINKKVSLIDLAPTICDLAGIGKPESFKGSNLFKNSREIIFHETGKNLNIKGRDCFVDIRDFSQCKIACQDNHFKYIFSDGKEELYNLFEDPREINNVFEGKEDISEKMRKIIENFKENNPPLQYV